MIRKKRVSHMILAASLAAALACTSSVAAFAADTADIDLGRKGSISLTLYSDEAGAAVTDGELTLYEAAYLTLNDGDMAYVKTDAFSGYEGALDVEDTGLAEALAGYAADYGVAGTVSEISADGIADFTDLALGLYLIVQTVESEGYYVIEPFLVTVPLAEGGGWVYDVDASPKVELNPEAETPPGTETPPETDNPPATDIPGTDTTDTETPGTDTPDTGTPASSGTGGSSGSSGSTGSSRLPQTGQLFWPIPLMACCGAFLFIAGAVLKKRRYAG